MKICPECHEVKGIREIVYGYPDPSIELDESKYVFGGCCTSLVEPKIKCIECGWKGIYRINQLAALSNLEL